MTLTTRLLSNRTLLLECSRSWFCPTLSSSTDSIWRKAHMRDKEVATSCMTCLSSHCNSFHSGRPLNKQKNTLRPGRVNMKPKNMRDERPSATIHHNMTVKQVAEALDTDLAHVLKCMKGIREVNNFDSYKHSSVIENFDITKKIVAMSGMKFAVVGQTNPKGFTEKENKDVFQRPEADPKDMIKRPPVVTIMGHVDHGKTTLLDALRDSNVVDQEFGGITQHIGAFTVTMQSGDVITFLDTPGHAAFSAMRARGARVTDMVVLVVAAEDGVMNQTVESAQHAKDAGVPVIVAINKIDRPGANIEGTKHGLLEIGIQLEDFGGDIQAVPISALKGTNIDVLQDSIVALAEVLEIKADHSGLVEGSVIESKTDPGRGKLSTALVQRGTLKKGAVLVAGTSWAKVRGMFNDLGKPLTTAGPGQPVEVLGWRDLPSAGDVILEVESEQRAREVIEWRKEQEKDAQIVEVDNAIQAKMEEHREDYVQKRQALRARGKNRCSIYRSERTKEVTGEKEGPALAIVLRGDVDGSVEAIMDVLDTYKSEQCQFHILNYGVGQVTPQDIDMAQLFKGIIYSFNTPVSEQLVKLAASKGVTIRHHNVIYRLFEEIRDELHKRLPRIEEEVTLGEADVMQTFEITDGKRKVQVAGCHCFKGSLQKKKAFKLTRRGETVYSGAISSLKHYKNEVTSVKTNTDCGISFEDRSLKPLPGDLIICFELQPKSPVLDWDLKF